MTALHKMYKSWSKNKPIVSDTLMSVQPFYRLQWQKQNLIANLDLNGKHRHWYKHTQTHHRRISEAGRVKQNQKGAYSSQKKPLRENTGALTSGQRKEGLAKGALLFKTAMWHYSELKRLSGLVFVFLKSKGLWAMERCIDKDENSWQTSGSSCRIAVEYSTPTERAMKKVSAYFIYCVFISGMKKTPVREKTLITVTLRKEKPHTGVGVTGRLERRGRRNIRSNCHANCLVMLLYMKHFFF